MTGIFWYFAKKITDGIDGALSMFFFPGTCLPLLSGETIED